MKPCQRAALYRMQLETALTQGDIPEAQLLNLSRQLDRQLNTIMRVRAGHFTRLPLRGVQPLREARPCEQVSRALP